MNYTLHQLQLFLKIVEKKSITKAAEELFLTQPAVSIQLKNFQDQFDIPLTEVIGRQLFVTNFGNEIAQIAQRIVNEVQTINYKTQAYKGILSGKLKIAIVSTGKYVMPYFLTDFIEKYLHIELEIDVTNRKKVIESLKKNDVDFALVSVLPDDFEVNSEPILENKLYLMGKNNSEFEINKKQNSLNDVPLLFREKGSGTRLVMENYFKKNQIKSNIKMQLTSNEAVKQAVIAGLGLSILPLIGCKNELKNNELQIIPVNGFPIKSEWNLIWLPNKKLSPVAQKYIDFIQLEKNNIQKTNFDWILNY